MEKPQENGIYGDFDERSENWNGDFYGSQDDDDVDPMTLKISKGQKR